MPDAKLLPDRFEKFPQPTNEGVEAWIYSSFRKDAWRARV